MARLRNHIPEVSQIIDHELSTTIRQPAITFAGGVFDSDHDVFLLRELLIRIQRNWTHLASVDNGCPTCPISISPSEMSQHRIDGRRWNEFKNLQRGRNIPVANEGWVPLDEFEVQKDNLRHLVDDIMASLKSEQRQEFLKRIELWKLTDWEYQRVLIEGGQLCPSNELNRFETFRH